MLVFGGIGTALGVFRTASVGALAVFLLAVTPIMHDFWRVPRGVQREQETMLFLKNATTFGASLVLSVLSTTAWPYTV
jgi:putative oxidoreductase